MRADRRDESCEGLRPFAESRRHEATKNAAPAMRAMKARGRPPRADATPRALCFVSYLMLPIGAQNIKRLMGFILCAPIGAQQTSIDEFGGVSSFLCADRRASVQRHDYTGPVPAQARRSAPMVFCARRSARGRISVVRLRSDPGESAGRISRMAGFWAMALR